MLGCSFKKPQNDLLTSEANQSTSPVIIQVYVLTIDAKEAEVDWFYEDLQHLLGLIPKKKKKKKIFLLSEGIEMQK